ncbi:MAG: glycosyltransferase family A protein [Coriobacteriia bacterium]|nr:glycosyltransferase family A protein [Coriobacteriia bacterium]
MTLQPRFSVTIPAYNAVETLAETVASVQAQTFTAWELVICNDGSTDGTLELAHELARTDERIRVVSQENRGTGGAYNTAVRNASADLLVLLSADDLLLPDHLAAYAAATADHPEAGVFSSGGYFEYEDGTRVESRSNTRWKDPSGCTIEELLRECFYGIGATYRRGVWEAQGGFQEGIYAEDYPFWLFGMAHGYAHHYLDQPLSVHRRNSVQKSADAIRMREADLIAVERLVASGLLEGADLAAARRAVTRFKRVIRARKVLNATLGADRSTRLIDRLRGRKPVSSRRD